MFIINKIHFYNNDIPLNKRNYILCNEKVQHSGITNDVVILLGLLFSLAYSPKIVKQFLLQYLEGTV